MVPGGSGPGPPDPGGGFELLEHTADVGIRARGGSLEEVFEHATEGLAEVMGALRPEGSGGPPGWSPGESGGAGEPPGWSPGGSEGPGETGPGEPVAVEVSAGDPGGLLVDWLNEVLWLREVRQAVVTGVRVERVGDGVASGEVVLAAGGPGPDGTLVKAVTYHRLRVEADPGGGWLAEVYLDV
jgi:SHS2 domain-containing protein